MAGKWSETLETLGFCKAGLQQPKYTENPDIFQEV